MYSRIKYISFDLARILKEIGYDDVCNSLYQFSLTEKKHEEDGFDGPFGWKKGELDYESRIFMNNNKDFDYTSKNWYFCARPTHQMVSDWFREIHNIHITITSISQESWQYHIQKPGDKLGKVFGEDYSSYYDALEDCLLHCTKLIK